MVIAKQVTTCRSLDVAYHVLFHLLKVARGTLLLVAIALACWGFLVSADSIGIGRHQPALASSSFEPVENATSTSLEAVAARAEYRLDEPLSITYRFTNGESPCMVSSSAAAALQITALELDGRPLQPQLAVVHFEDGYASAVASTLTELAARGSTTLGFTAYPGDDGARLRFTTLAAANGAATYGIESRWPIDSPGHYRLTTRYQAPWVDNISRPCSASTPVTVEFDRKDADAEGVLPYVAAALVLVAVVVVILFLRGRRRQGPAALTLLVVFLVAVSGVSLLEQRPVWASIDVDPAIQKRFEQCKSKFQAPRGDPAGVYERTANADGGVKVRQGVTLGYPEPPDLPGSRQVSYPAPGGTVVWDLDPTQPPLAGGVPRDACSQLYHELAHADEQLKNGKTDSRICAYAGPNGEVISNIPMTEVAATRAENQYRKSQGLPLRTSYGLDGDKKPKALPPDGGPVQSKIVVGHHFWGHSGEMFGRRRLQHDARGAPYKNPGWLLL
jgi:hypothetical protein